MINGLYAYYGTNRQGAYADAAEINFVGGWSSAVNYAESQAVLYGNATYLCLVSNSNSNPTDTTNATRPLRWSPLALVSSYPPTAVSNILISGNTAGTTQGINGAFILAGANNITLSQVSNTVSVIGGAGGGGGGAVISAGTNSQNTGTVVFSNSNGVSFGLATDGKFTASVVTNYQTPGAYLTTAMQSNAVTISNINVSAGTTSSNVSAIQFSNSNGISWGYDGTNVTATVKTDYQSSGPYLTTAMQSQSSSVFAKTGFTSTTTAGTALVGTLNTDGLSVGVPAFLTTAMQSNAATISNVNVSAGTTSSNLSAVTFSNSNGVSFGLGTGASAGVVTATVATNYQSQGAYLTTAMQSQSSSVFAKTGFTSTTTAGTAIVGTHDTNGLSLGVPAFLTTAMQSNAATISNINVSAGTTSSNVSAVTFSNANGVSFGLGTGASAGQITATVATNYQSQGAYLTTAALSTQTLVFSLGGNSATTNSSQISNGGFVLAGGNSLTIQQSNNTISFSVGNYITTADLSQNSSKYAGTGFTSTTTAGTAIVGTHNTAGLSLGVPAYLTTAMQSNAATISNINVSAGTTSTNASAYTFSNANGVSFGLGTGASAGVVTASVNPGVANINLSAGTTSTNAAAFTFSNANGVSFGLGTGASAGVVTGTVQTNYLTTAALSSQTLLFSLSGNIATTNSSQISNGAYALAGGNNVTLQQSNNTVSISVGNYITTAALSSQTLVFSLGGNSATTNSSQISNGGFILAGGNSLTIQQSNNTISFSVGNYITTADLSQNSSKYAGTAGAITGGSITVNTSGVSVNLPAYLTTAAQSTQTLQFTLGGNVATTNSSQIANGGFILAGGNSLTIQQSNNSISLSVGNYITTAMQSNAATISNVNISAGTTSTNASAFTFSNANGVSFGLGTGASAGVVTGTVATNYQSQGAYLTTAALSSQTLAFSLSGNTATTNSSQISNGGFALAGGNNVTLQQSNNTVSISVGNYITTAALSTQTLVFSLGGNSATTNSSQISNGGFILAGGNSLTIQQSNNTISFSVGNYITTAALSSQTLVFSLGGNSATTNSSQISNGGFVLAGGANVTIQQSNNTISISGASAAPSPVNISAGTTSNNLGSVVFSNSNNLSFGLSGSTITASFNAIDIGISTNGNTAGTTGIFDGGGLQYVFVGTNGITLSQSSNASSVTLSLVGPGDPYVGYLEPLPMTNTALFGPPAGAWHFAPFVAPEKMSGGRINLLHVNTSTASLFIDITGASYHSGSTGTLQQSFSYSKNVALYSQGSGTNSTRLESFWSNSFSFGWSKDVRVSLSQASNINITVAHSISYISEIGSNGAYTLNQFASAISTTVANSSTASNQFTNAGSSIRNMLSNSIIEPIGLNTTIQPGAYWLAFMWSTTRSTTSTGGLLGSAPDFLVSSECGISRLVLESAFRNWGSTNTTARSHIMPYGQYTVNSANPPQFVALSSDLSSLASAWVPYFNFQYQGITK